MYISQVDRFSKLLATALMQQNIRYRFIEIVNKKQRHGQNCNSSLMSYLQFNVYGPSNHEIKILIAFVFQWFICHCLRKTCVLLKEFISWLKIYGVFINKNRIYNEVFLIIFIVFHYHILCSYCCCCCCFCISNNNLYFNEHFREY